MTDRERASEIERAFLAAYDEYADALFRHCFVRIRDREIARDIVQEAYTRTWDYLAQGKEIEHLRAFLYRVANNIIVDTARKRRNTSLDAMIDDDGFEPADEDVEKPEKAQELREAFGLLDELDEMYRVTIAMRYLDELSPGEIARALKISENVVSVRIHRGLAKLREIVKKRTEGSIHK